MAVDVAQPACGADDERRAVVARRLTASAAGGAFHRDRTALPKSLSHPAAQHAIHSAGTGGAVARTIAGLAIVIAVVFGIYWLLKTYAKGKTTKGDGRLAVVATTPLAANRAVHLIRVGDTLELVGSADGGVTGIRSYSPEESALLERVLDAGTPETRPFTDGVLGELRRRTARR
jgi:flagellar protein FliO/FliZ